MGVPWVPAGVGPQRPASPGRSHRSQVPVQAPSQQTPSTQEPERQSVPRVQTAPSTRRGTQVPAVHSAPGAQSWALVHPTAQLPPAAQSAPLHAGSTTPAESGEQLPGALPLQVKQAPSHAEAQHTPSTQKPDAQAAAEPHALPSGCFGAQAPPSTYVPSGQPTQRPASQDWPGAQVTLKHSSARHCPSLHAVPSGQVPLVQSVGAQTPPLAQTVPGGQSTSAQDSSVHAPETQTRPAGHGWPVQSSG